VVYFLLVQNQFGYNTYIHGNITRKPMYSYLKQIKMPFIFYRNGEQEDRTGPIWGVGISGREKDVGEGVGG
jgi:hypothetical protein